MSLSIFLELESSGKVAGGARRCGSLLRAARLSLNDTLGSAKNGPNQGHQARQCPQLHQTTRGHIRQGEPFSPLRYVSAMLPVELAQGSCPVPISGE